MGLFATLYTSLGGVRAVIWTDVIQAFTLGGGMLLVLVLTVRQIDGGLAGVVQIGIENGKFAMFDMSPDPTRRGHLPRRAFAGVIRLSARLHHFTNHRATLRLDQEPGRRAAVPGHQRDRRDVRGGSLLFRRHRPCSRSIIRQRRPVFPTWTNRTSCCPISCSNEIQQSGLTGLLVAGLFAAVMSTIDSGINSLTAVVVYDWLSERDISLRFSRVLCGVFGLGVIAAALAAPYLGNHVIDIISVISGAFLGLLLGVFLIGMFSARANTPGAVVGLLAGMASLVYVWSSTDVSGWWYGACTSLPVVVVGTVASYLFPTPRPEQLRGLVSHR